MSQIIERAESIEGWFTAHEAALLAETAARALPGNLVEIGSYKGRSTIVLASVVRELSPESRVYAIDPHEGEIEAGKPSYGSTLVAFCRNLAEFSEFVVPIVKPSYAVEWKLPIRLLFIDGLHDHASVLRDFWCFADYVDTGGYVAFHDFSRDYLGVVSVVGTAARSGYVPCAQVDSLMVMCKQEIGQCMSNLS